MSDLKPGFEKLTYNDKFITLLCPVTPQETKAVKGEHWCKTKIKGAQDRDKTKTSASAVFEKNVLCKRNKPPKMKNLHFLASLLVARMYFARS